MLTRWAGFMLVLLMALAVGCGDEETAQLGMPGSDSAKKKKKAAAPEEVKPPPELSYEDEDFVELDTQNRDPFRGYAKTFKVQAAAPAQRRVLMAETSLDEMKLIAIVTNLPQPRAMLKDGDSVGHVVKAGDFVGRPEVVRTGGAEGMPVTLNWRVDRVRPGSIVLTREDPSAPDSTPLTRVLSLDGGKR